MKCKKKKIIIKHTFSDNFTLACTEVIYFVCMSMCCVYSKWYFYSKVSMCSMWCIYDMYVCVYNMHVCKVFERRLNFSFNFVKKKTI